MRTETREILDALAKTTVTSREEARGLPAAAYRSEELYALECEHIFRRDWICVGREELVERPGEFLSLELVGEPIVIVRDTHGTLHALSNVCRHRYMQLVEGCGSTEKFVCPYHGWTYRLDGSLAGAPHMTESRIFDRRACRLPEFRVESWLGFLFVNLDPTAEPLAPRHEAARERLAAHRLEEMRTTAAYDEIWNGNWKLSTENGLEQLHTQQLHPGTAESWSPASTSRVEPNGEVGSWLLNDLNIDALIAENPEFGALLQRGAAQLPVPDSHMFTGYNMHPNLYIDQLPGFCYWLSFLPQGPAATHVIGGALIYRDELERLGAAFRSDLAGWMEVINGEDAQATWRLQASLQSRHTTRGPLSLKEGSLLDFHQFLARRLTDAA